MVERKDRRQTPDERTQALFSMDVSDLPKLLKNRVVGLAGTTKRVKLEIVVPYSKTPRKGEKELGQRYLSRTRVSIEDLKEGTLWAYPLPHRKMKEGGNVRQALIIARDHKEGKTCVQVLRSSKYHAKTGEFEPMEREGDTSLFFGLKNDDQVELKLLDDSEVLYIVKGGKTKLVKLPAVEKKGSKSDQANEYIKRLVK